jgi:hypothetical protein
MSAARGRAIDTVARPTGDAEARRTRMSRRAYILWLDVVVAACALGVTPPTARASDGEQRVIVAFEAGTAAAERREVRQELDAKLLDTIAGAQTQVVTVDGPVNAAARRAELDPAVRWAEPVVTGRAQFTPDDPVFAYQWGLRARRARTSTRRRRGISRAATGCWSGSLTPGLRSVTWTPARWR